MNLIHIVLNCIILEQYMREDVEDLLTRMALCNLNYVKEYKGLISQLFCWVIDIIKFEKHFLNSTTDTQS